MTKIEPVTYEEAMARFKNLYRMEKLPHQSVEKAEWYASDIVCGALVWVTPTKARIKGTVTAPEYRGNGHGAELLNYLIEQARDKGAKSVEAFARNPKWYLENGFVTKRVTKWDVTVVEITL